MSSLIHSYITLELAGSFAYREPSSDATWPEVLDELDRTLGRIALGRLTDQSVSRKVVR